MPVTTKEKLTPTKASASDIHKQSRVPSPNGSRSEDVWIDVMIQGVSPLQMDSFGADQKAQLQGGGKKAMTGQKPSPAEQAEAVGYFDLDGKPYIPNNNMFQCLVEAGQHIKYGKAKLTNAKSSRIPGVLDIDDDHLPVLQRHLTEDGQFIPAHWEPQLTTPTNSLGSKSASWRPFFFEWYVPFTIKVDAGSIDLQSIRELLDAAGKWVGLGPQRPSRKGRFGKFVVVKFEIKPNLGHVIA